MAKSKMRITALAWANILIEEWKMKADVLERAEVRELETQQRLYLYIWPRRSRQLLPISPPVKEAFRGTNSVSAFQKGKCQAVSG
jgi:hypothetical protein